MHQEAPDELERSEHHGLPSRQTVLSVILPAEHNTALVGRDEPGVIDVTSNYVEHPQVVADRLVQFAKVVGREQLIASTDSGFAAFATGVEFSIVTP
jgi:hypothetical protein